MRMMTTGTDADHFSFNHQLFLGDIEEIGRILSRKGWTFEMYGGGEKLTGLDGLADLAALGRIHPIIPTVFIKCSKIDEADRSEIMLTIKQGFAHFTLWPENLENLGLMSLVQEVLDRCRVAPNEDQARWAREKWDTIVLQPRPVAVKYALSPSLKSTNGETVSPAPSAQADVKTAASSPAVKPTELKDKSHLKRVVEEAHIEWWKKIVGGAAAGILIVSSVLLRKWLHWP